MDNCVQCNKCKGWYEYSQLNLTSTLEETKTKDFNCARCEQLAEMESKMKELTKLQSSEGGKNTDARKDPKSVKKKHVGERKNEDTNGTSEAMSDTAQDDVTGDAEDSLASEKDEDDDTQLNGKMDDEDCQDEKSAKKDNDDGIRKSPRKETRGKGRTSSQETDDCQDPLALPSKNDDCKDPMSPSPKKKTNRSVSESGKQEDSAEVEKKEEPSPSSDHENRYGPNSIKEDSGTKPKRGSATPNRGRRSGSSVQGGRKRKKSDSDDDSSRSTSRSSQKRLRVVLKENNNKAAAAVVTPNLSTKTKSKDQTIDQRTLENLKKPFDYGWLREIVYRSDNISSDVYYYSPGKKKKFRSVPKVVDYLRSECIDYLERENFSFRSIHLFPDDSTKETYRYAKSSRSSSATGASDVSMVDGDTTEVLPRDNFLTPELTDTSAPASILSDFAHESDDDDDICIVKEDKPNKGPKKIVPLRRVVTAKPPTSTLSTRLPLARKVPAILSRKAPSPKIPSLSPKVNPSTSQDKEEIIIDDDDEEPEGRNSEADEGGIEPCGMGCPLAAVGDPPSMTCQKCYLMFHPICQGFQEAPAVFTCVVCKSTTKPAEEVTLSSSEDDSEDDDAESIVELSD